MASYKKTLDFHHVIELEVKANLQVAIVIKNQTKGSKLSMKIEEFTQLVTESSTALANRRAAPAE